MSGNVPRVVGGTVAAAATQLPNTGPSDLLVTLAAFVAGFMVVWFAADLFAARNR